jgi:hypothetical protein
MVMHEGQPTLLRIGCANRMRAVVIYRPTTTNDYVCCRYDSV